MCQKPCECLKLVVPADKLGLDNMIETNATVPGGYIGEVNAGYDSDTVRVVIGQVVTRI